jgi:hypothetical protein
MSGGSNGTTQTSSMPDWAVPYAKGYLDQTAQIASQPYQAYGGQRQAGLNQTQYAGLDAIQNRAMNGSPLMDAASQTLQNTAGGGYLNSNPYLDQNVNAAMQNTVKNYQLATAPQRDRQMASSGSFGNSGVQQMQLEDQRQLSNNLGNMASQMYGQNYANERQLQQQSLSMAPSYANQDYLDAAQLMGAGNILQNNQQAGLNQDYQNWLDAKNYPSEQLAIMNGGFGPQNGQTTTQQGGQGSALGKAGGGALAGYSMFGPWGAAAGAGLGLLG